MKHNRGSMDLQRWMTRFQITGNRLIESWMDLLPDVEMTNPEAAVYIEQQRQAHVQQQQNLAGIAAQPGQPHAAVAWTDELA